MEDAAAVAAKLEAIFTMMEEGGAVLSFIPKDRDVLTLLLISVVVNTPSK